MEDPVKIGKELYENCKVLYENTGHYNLSKAH